jgi:YfiH family protein
MSERPVPLSAPALSGLPGIAHGFFSRRGGVSTGIYDSLNGGYGSRDDRAAVRENRERAVAALGGEAGEVATAYQVHGRHVVAVEAPWAPGAGPKADGMVTDRPGVPLGILTADCAPVLFADAEAGIVGAAHAGWRGAVSGIIEETIATMVTLGARIEHIHAAVGPAIGPQSYEVGAEFPRPFLDHDDDNRHFFRPAPRAGHYLFDLPGFVMRVLDGLGLAGVSLVARDTCAEADGFFSYRRACHEGDGDYGRNLSLVMLEK